MAVVHAAEKSPQAFRTISEVAAELDVPQHVLRFWETKFAAVKPLKRGGGRRYYRPDDVDLLRGIRSLLYSDGLTIKGVQKILREQGPRYVMELGRSAMSLLQSPRAARSEGARLAPAPVAVSDSTPSNVHPFPREKERRGLSDTERARFTTILDELLELKSRMVKARAIRAVAQ